MDFRELEYFVAIAQQENLTRAAEKFYISQPTLSKFLQRLETEIGLPLFQRIGKRMTLTYAGQRYLTYAKRLLATKLELDHEMSDILKSDIGLLRVGMPPFRCSFALPAVLPEFHRLYPNVEICITEDSSNSLDTALLGGQIDLAFYNVSDFKAGLHYQVFAQDKLYAVLPKGHPVSKRAFLADNSRVPQICLEWLADEIFLVQNRNQRQGQYILRELKEKHIVPVKIQESSNIRAAALLAANGYGVAFLSGGLLQHFETTCEFDYYALADCSYPINYVAAWREGGYLPAYALDFIRLMREKTCEKDH